MVWVGDLLQEESCALHRSALRNAGGRANAGGFSSQIVGRIGSPLSPDHTSVRSSPGAFGNTRA